MGIDIDLLPPVLQDLVRLIGLHATMKLVQAYGGVRLYVPKTEMDDNHTLVRLLGRDAADTLRVEYGGEEHFDLPKGERAMLEIRNARIRASCRSIRSLALEHSLTERQIRAIRNRGEEDRQQSFPDLYPTA